MKNERDSATIWQPLFAGTTGAGQRRSHGVYSSVELQQLLDYERQRAERSGLRGSVVICQLNGNAGSARKIRRLVTTVARTVRETDHIGWMGKEELAIVLPGTAAGAAESLKGKFLDSGLLHDEDVRIDAL
ncbi:MAG: hypothetical protein EA404_08630 [Spirochaetaceae bacterium]|nr:MAG: hypothetical protein EA404_08630 [Spirochaetaceae bacterium]